MKFKLFLILFIFSAFTLNAQILKYTNGNNAWNPDSLGNHRVVVLFNETGKVAHVKINWRRRDEHPELKKIIIQDSNGKNVSVLGTDNLSRESADVYFEATTKGKYFVYYMPYKNEGRSNYPKGVYLKADSESLNKANKIAINS
ncbi:MAG: hypothetical protein EOO96_28930, partial [Pedobacter sp.]